MKLINFLLKSVVVMFVFLFALFGIYIYNDNQNHNQTIKSEPEFVEIEVEKIKIEPIIAQEEIEEPVLLQVEPAQKPIENNNQEEIINTNKFYYSNLDEYSKLIYEALENQKNNLKTGNSTISIPNQLGEVLENEDSMETIFTVALRGFENDNPDIFYLDTSKMVLYYERDVFGNYKIYIKNDENYDNYLINGFNSEQDIQSAQNTIDEIVTQIQNDINMYNDDYNKILYIHDWLTKNVKYDETISRDNKDTIYGSLVEGEAVCTGYAKAFKYLLDRLNLKTIIVQGIGINDQGQEYHAWNYAQLNNKWYGVDCTWDDPIIIGDLTNYIEKPYYTYFLKGQNVFNSDHIPLKTFNGTDLKINYPELNVEDY